MKREKLICCNVIVRQDRCTVLHLCFQALNQPLARIKKNTKIEKYSMQTKRISAL